MVAPTNPAEMLERLQVYEQDAALYTPSNVPARAGALEYLAFVNQMVRLRRRDHRWGSSLPLLTQRAQALAARLQRLDEQFFQTLRRRIRAGELSAPDLRRLLNRYTGYTTEQRQQAHYGYDDLDLVIQGLIRATQAPQPTQPLTAEMVHYEPTPARAILDMIDHAGFKAGDVFYDLGAGLGGVAILVGLLSPVQVKGIELEPAFCDHARRCAAELGLSQVDFIAVDARQADYSDGTLFFMFTPFTGQILQAVLMKLQREAAKRPLRLCTYGPCTLEVAAQSWLKLADPTARHAYRLAVFDSR